MVRLVAPRSSYLSIPLLSLLVLVMVACAPIPESDAESAMPFAETRTASPSAGSVYRNVAPSIAFLETPSGTGSGILTVLGGDNYVVTNAHVVWPFRNARVVFSNGAEFLDVPVVETDELVDLAVLGPLETDIPPISIRQDYKTQPGDTVYLIGYPGEGELFPVPSISEGILSRTRVWDSLNSLRFYQTDATGVGGQSGGVLVNADGEVLGISGMLFADEFVLATSSADLSDRLDRMVAGAGSEDPRPAAAGLGTPRRRHTAQLLSLWDTDGYLMDAPFGADITVEVDSDADLGLLLFDSVPEQTAAADNSFGGSEVVSDTVSSDGPQYVVVEQYVPGRTEYRLVGSHRLTPINDEDDGQSLTTGETYTGTINYPADIDWFVISLARGDEVTVLAEAAMIDPVLAIGPSGSASDEYVEDDDGGRGMLGSSAALAYRASSPGDYLVVVRSFTGADVGGYLLTIASPK